MVRRPLTLALTLTLALLTLALTLTLSLAPRAASAATPATPTPFVLVLDASGSMWGEVRGEAKIAGARRVVAETAAGLPPGTPLTLVAYGHRREGDCADIETVLPSAPIDAAALGAAVGRLTPKGKTPLAAALDHALRDAPPGATIVLVTDGLETCGGDPCGVVRTAASRGRFVLHVIGLDVAKEDVSSLECAAATGGGLFLPAADAAELGRALATTVDRMAEPLDGSLLVRATRNGALQDVVIRVTPQKPRAGTGGAGAAPTSAAEADIVARTYAQPETNPRTIPLAAGTYRLHVRPVGIDGAAALEREEDVSIVAAGAPLERAFDFSTGALSIGATRNGALSDVTWQVFAPGDRRRAVATGRTYRTASANPAKTTLPAGTYDVVLTALEIAGKPTWEASGVRIAPGTTPVAVAHDFPSGEIAIEVVRGEALVDATVTVRGTAGAVSAVRDQGRTYTAASSNPIRFTLPPGSYAIEVAEIRGARRTLEVTVAAGAVERRRVDLAASPGTGGE